MKHALKATLVLAFVATVATVATAQDTNYAVRISCDFQQQAGTAELPDLTLLQGSAPMIQAAPMRMGRAVAADSLTTCQLVFGPSATSTYYVATNAYLATNNAYYIQLGTIGTNSVPAGSNSPAAWWYSLLFYRNGGIYWSGSGRLYIERTTATGTNGLVWQTWAAGVAKDDIARGWIALLSNELANVEAGVVSYGTATNDAYRGDWGAAVSNAAAAVQSNLTAHAGDVENPHAVTAEQIGALTAEIDAAALSAVAAVSGRVDTIEGWGNHAAAGYATGTPVYVESDPIFSATNAWLVRTNDSAYTATVAKAASAVQSGDSIAALTVTNLTANGDLTIHGRDVKSRDAVSVGPYGAAFGVSSAGNFGFAAGENTSAGTAGFAAGAGTSAGDYGFAAGLDTSAGNFGFAAGRDTSAGEYGFAAGFGTSAGSYGFAAGLGTSAGNYGFAAGQDTSAGFAGFAAGSGTSAGDGGFAAGASTTAGDYGFAAGESTTAGNYGFAAGEFTSAGDFGFAAGESTSAGDYGFAAGVGTSAGYAGFAAGEITSAGIFGFAAGDDTSAGDYGFAAGAGTSAGDFGFASGRAAGGADGSFVFADNSTGGEPFNRTNRPNEFSARAAGGVYFDTPMMAVTGTVSAGSFAFGDGDAITNWPRGDILGATINEPHAVVTNDGILAFTVTADGSGAAAGPVLAEGTPQTLALADGYVTIWSTGLWEQAYTAAGAATVRVVKANASNSAAIIWHATLSNHPTFFATNNLLGFTTTGLATNGGTTTISLRSKPGSTNWTWSVDLP